VRARQDRRHDADDSLPAFVHPSKIRLSSLFAAHPWCANFAIILFVPPTRREPQQPGGQFWSVG
jgi:hypothetical protein